MENSKHHNIPDLPKVTGMSRSFWYEQLKTGRIRAKKCGRRTLIADTELQRFMSELPEYGEVA